MTMETEFRAALIAAPGVGLPGTRINWGAHPQGAALPAIVLNTISSAEGLTMQGRDGLRESRVQVDCYAETIAAALNLSRAVEDAIIGRPGGGFQLVRHDGTRTSREGGTNEAERVYRAAMDFTTFWRAT